jgi:hypothetical protein
MKEKMKKKNSREENGIKSPLVSNFFYL